MKINILSIAKKENDHYEPIRKEYMKLISKHTQIEDIVIFNKKIASSQTQGTEIAKASYSEAFEPYLHKSYNIVLHPKGKELDSFEFSKLLSDRISVNFFIGGAYGFNDDFINKSDKTISLSTLTMSHKIAKVVLLEQIYRGFSILTNHPYHK